MSATSVNTIKSFATMKKTFDSMTVEKEGGKYVDVWGTLTKRGAT